MQIVLYPHPALLEETAPVLVFDHELHKELDEMKVLMIEHNGLGLSANQVGLNKRMFVMETSKGVIDVINPHIVDMQGNMTIPEGCLSSPGVNEIVYTRPQEMTLEYQDRHGEKHVGVVFDFEAMCASHEIDHLNGIFWFSKLPNKKIRKRIEAKWDKLKK